MKYVSDEDIYEHYLQEKISLRKRFFSPFREESNPSLTFVRMTSGDVLWRDWGDGDQCKPESVIKFVMKIYGCGFSDALSNIRRDMSDGTNTVYITKRPYTVKHVEKKREIQIKSRPFDINDIDYWSQYEITTDTLSQYDVIPISEWYYNNYPMDQYDGFHPLYAYKMTKGKSIYYKIYNPLTIDIKRKWRWNGSDDIIQGYDQLPLHGELLILTKSLKDVMVLHEIGYSSISLQSEITEMDTLIFETISRRFAHIVVLYDNDATGIKRSNAMCRNFGLKSIMIPIERNIKDISDYVKSYGLEKGKTLMEQLLNQLELKI